MTNSVIRLAYEEKTVNTWLKNNRQVHKYGLGLES
jgi:hypothetical protein